MQFNNFINERVREYLLTDIVGTGGMGAVFKAYHVRLKARRAIKILKVNHYTK